MLGKSLELINLDRVINTMSQAKDFLSSSEAAQWLNVRRQTLYAYVSRGLVRSVQSPSSRERLYAREDLERLHQRAMVRDGQAAVAASALNLGHPIVVTSITEITPRGPSYRGRLAVDLAAQDAGFEQVAELLWSGMWHDQALVWPSAEHKPGLNTVLQPLTPTMAREQMAEVFALAVMQMGMGRGTVQSRLVQGRPLDAARELILALTGCLGFLAKGGAYLPPQPSSSVVSAVLRALGKPGDHHDQRLLNAMLVLLADHELSPGTFAARIAASSGSALHACLAAALAANSGIEVTRRYDRVEQFLSDANPHAQTLSDISRRVDGGQSVPGFEHPLYPSGDPRAAWLLEQLQQRRLPPAAEKSLAFIEKIAARHALHPRHELAVLVSCQAMRFPPGTAGGLFMLARLAGWVAHVLEQRLSPTLIRPRAKFV